MGRASFGTSAERNGPMDSKQGTTTSFNFQLSVSLSHRVAVIKSPPNHLTHSPFNQKMAPTTHLLLKP